MEKDKKEGERSDAPDAAVSSATNTKMVVESDDARKNEKLADLPRPPVTFGYFDKIIGNIKRAVQANQSRLIQKTLKQNTPIRRFAEGGLLGLALEYYVDESCPTKQHLIDCLMEFPVDSVISAYVSKETENRSNVADRDTLPEIEIYIATLFVTTSLRLGMVEKAAQLSTYLIQRLKQFNRRTLDPLSAKVYFYFSLSYERLGKLSLVRPMLLEGHRNSVVHHDLIGQSVLLNLVLHNFIQQKLYMQAQKLISRSEFPEDASNNQFCRYLYHLARVQAIQLEYSDSDMRLHQVLRKLPENNGCGFLLAVKKLKIIVQLLMGDIPARSTFSGPASLSLQAYFVVTQTVRKGSLPEFNQAVADYATVFQADGNYALVQRLGHNVIKTGLRRLCSCYSKISLQDIADRLCVDSVQTAEYICAKSIRDGVIDAKINHEEGWLISCSESSSSSSSSSSDQCEVYHKRIVFCLDVYNEAIKSMRYPPTDKKKKKKKNDDDEEKKKKEKDKDTKTEDEIVEEIEKAMDDEEKE